MECRFTVMTSRVTFNMGVLCEILNHKLMHSLVMTLHQELYLSFIIINFL